MDYNKQYGFTYISCFDWFSAVSGLASSAFSVYNNERSISSAKDQLEKEQEFNAEQAQLNREFQTSERLAAQEYNLDMWNLQNEYNSPEQQLQRLKAAGINPNAMYGSSQLANSASSVAPTTPMSGATASSPSIASAMVANGLQLSQMLAQTKNLNADTQLKKQQFDFNELTQPQQYELLKQAYEKNKVEIDNLLKDLDVKDVNIKSIENTMYWYSQLSEAQKMQMSEQLNLLRNQNIHEIEKINLTRAQKYETLNRAYLTEKQAELTVKQGEMLDVQIEGAKTDNALKKLELDFSNATGVPLGTSEFEMMFNLWTKGELDGFIGALTTKAVSIGASAIANVSAGKITKALGSAGRAAKGLFGRLSGIFNPSR